MVWLTRVCQVAWRFVRAPKDWQIDRPHRGPPSGIFLGGLNPFGASKTKLF